MTLSHLLAGVEQDVIEYFRKGGCVPYSAHPRFQRIMAEYSGAGHDESLIDATLPLVPGLVDRLRAGIDVAEFGCGCGHVINLMTQAFSNADRCRYNLR